MAKKHQKPKPAKLSRGFYEWLQFLETVETILSTKKPTKRNLFFNVNQDMFNCPDDDWRQLSEELGPVQAALAHVVRSSVKYSVTTETLIEMTNRYSDQLDYVNRNRPIHLPHEWCTLVLKDFPEGHPTEFIISLSETTPSASGDTSYPELGLGEDDEFISITFAMYRPDGLINEDTNTRDPGRRLSHCPIEMHMHKGRTLAETDIIPAFPKGVTHTPAGKQIIDLLMVFVLSWIESFSLASMLRQRQPGLPGGGRIPKPKGKRKPWSSQFEHYVCELEIDTPAPQQEGKTVFQPRKRMHRVRGFPRHLKSGKVVWVKSHWRGDKELGVVAKDYELTLHKEAEAT